MPASQTHHHAVPGGLLIHTLEVIEHAITYRQRYKLPAFAPQEVQEKEKHVWTYAVFLSAILHDVGKRVTMCSFLINKNGKKQLYTAFEQNKLTETGVKDYEIVFHDAKYHHLHDKLGLIFMSRLVPVEGQRFIFENLNIVKELFAYIHGDKFNSGNIGKIISEADGASTGKSLAHIKTRKFKGSSLENIGERIMTRLRVMLASNEIMINKPNAMCYTNEKYAYLVSPAFINLLRDSFYEAGEKDIPSDNNRMFDIFQEYGFADTNPETGRSTHWIMTQIDDKLVKLIVLKFNINKLFQMLPSAFDGTITELSSSEFARINTAEEKQNAQPETAKEVSQESKPTEPITEEQPVKAKDIQIDHDLAQSLITGTGNKNNNEHGTENEEKNNTGTGNLRIAKTAAAGKKDYAEDFMNWIKAKILANESNLYKINKAGGLVSYVLSDGNPCVALITPKVFSEFAKENGIPLPEKNYKNVQNDIHNKKLNIRAGNGQIHHMKLKKSKSGPMNDSPTLSFYLFTMRKFCDGDETLLNLFADCGENSNLYFAPRKK